MELNVLGVNSRSTVQRQYQSGLIFWIARARNNDLRALVYLLLGEQISEKPSGPMNT